METDFNIQGLDGVLKKMRGLPDKLRKKALRTAGNKAMRVVRDEARRVAATFDDPDSPSNIAKKIVTQYDTKGSKREGGAVTKVGVQGGARPRPGREDTGHWRLKEFGTEHMPAQPFMRPALENNIEQVTSVYVTALNAEIDKALR